jgi:hypothetical protein
MERFKYDRSSKWMIEHHGDAILRIGGVHDLQAWRPGPAEVVQPRQMPDGLLEVRRAGDDKFYPYVVEIETYPKSDTPTKLLDDIMLVCQARGAPPGVIVLVLHPKGDVEIKDSDEAKSRGGLTRLRGTWQVVKLWEVPAADLLATGDPGVMPWVPLARIDGPPEPVLQQCRRIIDERARPEEHANLLAVSQVLGGLRYNVATLRAIFGGKEKMIESPVLQELIAEQRAEAKVQTQHEAILDVLEARFGPVPAEVRSSLMRVTGEQRLRELIRQAAQCPDLDTFRHHLAP